MSQEALAVAALLLLGSKRPGSSDSNAGGQPPQTPPPTELEPGGGGGDAALKTALGLAGSLVPTIGGIIGKVTAGLGTGAAGAGAGAGGSGSAALAGGGALGGVSAISIAAPVAVAVLIVAAVVTGLVGSAVSEYHQAVTRLLGYDIRAGSLDVLVGAYVQRLQFTVKQLIQLPLNEAAVKYRKSFALTSADKSQWWPPIEEQLLRRLYLASLYVGIERCWARNLACDAFFASLGHSAQQRRETGESMPGSDFWEVFADRALLGGLPQATYNFNPITSGGLTNIGFTNEPKSPYPSIHVGHPSYAEVENAARDFCANVEGIYDPFTAVTRLAHFSGAAEGIVLAAIAGYTVGWPGDRAFAEGISQRTLLWDVRAEERKVGDERLRAYWLVDPNTGWAVAPIQSRERNQIVVAPA